MPLKIDNLSKRFKDKWVLRDVSFELSEGEIFGIFGPTGCGKSTLLSVVTGDESASGGTVTLDGREVAPAGRRKWKVANDGSIFGSFLSSRTKSSSLEQIERALCNSDSVLVLDDPFLGLDLRSQTKLVETIRTSAEERRIALMIASDNFDHIFLACDRAAVLAESEIRQIGTPRELYERPVSRVVAALTGPNNLFAARRLTSSKADIPEFHTIDGGHRLFAQKIERGALGAINQNVTLAIRPEHISLSTGASFPEDNLLRAQITGVKFLGSTTRIELDAGGLRLHALVLRLVGLDVGEECVVGLPPDRIHIFRD